MADSRRHGFSSTVNNASKDPLLQTERRCVVRVENINTNPFKVGKGVSQGCILSPHLFTLYTGDIMTNVENDERNHRYDEINVNGQKIRNLTYADNSPKINIYRWPRKPP